MISGQPSMSMFSSFSNVCSQLPILSIITSVPGHQAEKTFPRGFGSIHQCSCQDCPGFYDNICSSVFSGATISVRPLKISEGLIWEECDSYFTVAKHFFYKILPTLVISPGLCPKPEKRAPLLETEKMNFTEGNPQYKFYMLVYFMAPKIHLFLFLWDRPFFLA